MPGKGAMTYTLEDRPFDSKASLQDAAHQLISEYLQRPSDGPFAIMLSGGNTPLPVFARFSQSPVPVHADAWITYTDDRHVPETSPESNYGNSHPMLESLGLLDRTIRVQGNLELEAAADAFENDLKRFLDTGGTFPLALLGIGADGHTCSLFSDEDIKACENRLAAPIYRDSPPNRVTVSPSLLARVERIVIMAAGEDKQEMCNALRTNPESITAGKALANCKHVELWQA